MTGLKPQACGTKSLIRKVSTCAAMAYGRHGREFNVALQAERVAELTAASPVSQLMFNGLGSWLAASNADGQVQLWRPALDGTWSLLTSIEGTAVEHLS